tara:strand:- start:1350 stop:1628 length:279 start_codon:yes stop_codon:yes gene_type:complete
MTSDPDPGLMQSEPERYYEWMLWKLRQDEERIKQISSDVIDRTDSWKSKGIYSGDSILTREINKIKKQVNKIDKNLEELLNAVVQLQKQKDR